MRKVLHNLLGIIFILTCFCSLVFLSIWGFFADNNFGNFSITNGGDLSLKYEKFISDFFTFEHFFWTLFFLFLIGFVVFFIWIAVVFIFVYLVKWPFEDRIKNNNNISPSNFLNTYTVIGFVMIYSWCLTLWVTNNY